MHDTDCECAKFLSQIPHENIFNLHEFCDYTKFLKSQQIGSPLHEFFHA